MGSNWSQSEWDWPLRLKNLTRLPLIKIQITNKYILSKLRYLIILFFQLHRRKLGAHSYLEYAKEAVEEVPKKLLSKDRIFIAYSLFTKYHLAPFVINTMVAILMKVADNQFLRLTKKMASLELETTVENGDCLKQLQIYLANTYSRSQY